MSKVRKASKKPLRVHVKLALELEVPGDLAPTELSKQDALVERLLKDKILVPFLYYDWDYLDEEEEDADR